jgi:AraC-like DNA-binding protein
MPAKALYRRAMSGDHDQTSGFLDQTSQAEGRHSDESGLSSWPSETAIALDPLSDLLRTVKLSGALFFLVDATSPWCVDIPDANQFSEILLPQARSIISYHIVVQGSGFASVPGIDLVPFGPGDIIVFPHGDPYRMESAPGTPPEFNREETMYFFRELAAGRLSFVVREGGGEDPPAQFICGFLGCDAHPFNPLLDALPRLLHIKRPTIEKADLIDRLIGLTLTEMQMARVGGNCIRLGLSELLFVEAVRRHLENVSLDQGGWLNALRDPIVGRALTLLHAQPSQPWTLEKLARETGTSRSVLAERFSRLVGQSPMKYLTRWRVQIAARMLSDGKSKVSAIAIDIGYASEAAFSRIFKKVAGVSPSTWRERFGPQA